jgi:mono/diheme cytochrome c family protein
LRLILITGLATATLLACTPPSPPQTGASDFADLCAPCHGTGGEGNGPMAADLTKKPADLTGLSARNGGTFPMVRVMNKIWGYSRGADVPSMMPKFAPLLESDTVLVDMGDGVQTPTPQRLIDLADYLATIQG